MLKIYVKASGKPVGYTSKESAVMGVLEEHEVEEIQPIMLFGKTPDGQTFVTHSSSKISSWARHRAGVVIQEFQVYS